MSASKISKSRVAISRVEPDGTILETLYAADTVRTTFVIARETGMENCDDLAIGTDTFIPISPHNNLIKHNALLLPSEAADYGNSEQLLGDIQKYIRRYVSLPDHALGISAAYVLLSWVYDAFNELPYLRFRGDYGTGKTRALLVVGSLCYKAFFASGASTVSPIFHTLDTFKGTLIFDEADFRFTDEKAELVKILNNGNAKGFPVLRTHVTQQREFNPQAFTIFGPKIVGMRRSYDDRALESRFLTIEMESGQVGNVPINLPDEQKGEALALRNKLLMYRLRNRLKTAIDPTLADHALESRMNQILLPLLSVIPSEPLRTVIRQSAQAVQASIITDRSASAEGQVLSIVTRLYAQQLDTPLALAEIAEAFTTEYGAEYERSITNRWTGAVLRRLGLTLYKRNGVFVIAPGQGERITALLARYGITEGGEKLDASASREIGT